MSPGHVPLRHLPQGHNIIPPGHLSPGHPPPPPRDIYPRGHIYTTQTLNCFIWLMAHVFIT